MFRCTAAMLLAGVSLACTVSPLTAQTKNDAPNSSQTQAQSGFVLKQTVRRVILDVVVTDAKGNPVPGLHAKDFSVQENGKDQSVLSFGAYDLNTPNQVLPRPPSMPVNTFIDLPNTPERGPLYVIVYDAVHMDMEKYDQAPARQQLIDFLSGKPVGTRFALFVLSDGLHMAQGFTSDPHQLLDAFDTHRKGAPHVPWTFLYADNYPAAPLETLTFLAHYLQGLPGRKNLVWLASSMPVSLPPLPMQGASLGAQGFTGSTPGDNEDEIKEAIRALTAAQVSVYPIDVAGPGAPPDIMADEIADDTGGHAYYGTNDIKGAIADMAVRGSTYYELSYSPSNQVDDGKIRKIRVNLQKQGYHLAYRRYYYAASPDVPTPKKQSPNVPDYPVAAQQGDKLFAYMEHGAPMGHEVLFAAHIGTLAPPALATPEQMANLAEQPAYFHAPRKNKPAKLPPPIPVQTYFIDFKVFDRSTQGQGSAQAVLEFAAAAYDAEGTLLNGEAQDAVRTLTPSQSDKNEMGLFRARKTIEVPTTAVWLRIAVRDLTNDRIGTLEVPLPLAPESQTALNQP